MTRAETDAAPPLDAVLFDMDGVVTDTAEAHASAWKQLFDAYLERRAKERGEDFRPFDPRAEYREHVDGKPRYDGVRSFLESRGIELPFGSPDDAPDAETICGLGNRKNRYFNAWLEQNRARRFDSTVALIEALRAAGMHTAVFTSSRNADAVLQSAGIRDLFDVQVDGNWMAEKGLPGKPDPAIMGEAASALGVAPARAAVVEDAIAGVEAGARGGFGLVIGVDRGEYGEALRKHGAHVVVHDLGELVLQDRRLRVSSLKTLPAVWTREDEIRRTLADRRVAVFLDYDGTLTPIVTDYTQAVLSDAMRATIEELARHYTVAIVSGRDIATLRELVGIGSLFYAGSHGFEIGGPEGFHETLEKGEEARPELDGAERELRDALRDVPGHAVERKPFAIEVHYRRAAADDVPRIEEVVDRVRAAHAGLRKGFGKKVFRLQPDIAWDKGYAVRWLLGRLDLNRPEVLPLYVGDDVTDEDAFRTLAGRGLCVVVHGEDDERPTSARYALADVADVQRFLKMLIALAAGRAR